MQLYILVTFHGVLVVFDEYTGAARGLVVRAAVPVVWINGLYCGRHYVGIDNNSLHALGRRPI
jgi:hypothetical protein